MENIKSDIDSVKVFTKIPSGSINIPLPNGYKYSPDFAYLISRENGETSLIVETKGKKINYLHNYEKYTIEVAEQYFRELGEITGIDIQSSAQIDNKKMKISFLK